MKERINVLMEMYNMSPTQFAQAVGMQRSTLQHIMNGRNEPSLNVVRSIHAALPDVDLDWLLTGEGKPLKGEQTVGITDDYPLFRAAENPIFRPEGGTSDEFSVHEAVKKPSRTRKRAENKSVESVNASAPQEPQMRVKEIVVFYEDGTYQKFSSNLLKK